MALVQHVFKCRSCSFNRPCIHIYVDNEALDIDMVKEHMNEFKCGIYPCNFKHEYSIPYEDD